jgi:Tol biopolymer transport system component
MRDVDASGSDEYAGAWAPHSSRYVYLTNKNGEEELRIHSQAENWDRLVVTNRALGPTTVMSAPVASPDGQRVAFDVYGTATASSIWISPAGGGAPLKLTREGAAESAPEWSPDGQSIVCNYGERGVVGLAVVRVGTSDSPRVLAHGIEGIISAWSPSGEWIAYRTAEAVRLVSPDGARRRLLTTSNTLRGRTGLDWDNAFVWSRDSSTLYSIRRQADRTVQLVAIDTTTGAVRVVSALGADVHFGTPSDPGLRLTLAPDGKSILATIVRTRTSLWILEDFALGGGLLDWFPWRRSR